MLSFQFFYGVLIIKINGSYAQREKNGTSPLTACNTLLRNMAALNVMQVREEHARGHDPGVLILYM